MSSNADISLTTSSRANIKIGKPSSKGVKVSDPTMPKYVGARAVVTREEDGSLITLSDYKGTTQAMVYDGSLPMYFGTTEEWDSQTTLVSEENAVYVYTDYKTIDGEQIAGFKVGDGLAYVVDLPFTDAVMESHMNDTDIHVTSEEKAFWNAKVRGIVAGENLILTDL